MGKIVRHKCLHLIRAGTAGRMMQEHALLMVFLTVILHKARFVQQLKMQLFV
jgi:hypothetical protein